VSKTQVLHVTGARPNFPKAAPVIKALADRGVTQKLVHTGQHYDDAMSTAFFRDLNLPRPDVNLNVGSGSHAQQTARIMMAFEEALLDIDPKLVVVYGDVNSTVAAALVASKLNYPIAHVEAGLRSFDMSMPEEINRILTDQLTTLLFTTSPEAEENLRREGVEPDQIHFVGNPMIDTLLSVMDKIRERPSLAGLQLPNEYVVVTLHRPANVDSPEAAREVVSKLHACASVVPLVIPVHPRSRPSLDAAGLSDHVACHVVEPVNYLGFVALVRHAIAVITDSGGVQEESTMLGVPCLTLRLNTERPITISHGTNQLVELGNLPLMLAETLSFPQKDRSRGVPPLWDGHAGQRVAIVLHGYVH